jgi:hypothetical protein
VKNPRKKLNPDTIEIAVVDITEKFRRLSLDESKGYMHKALG